jgi:2-keto-4-pentenoate hydratase/2-oxohepta-3-ene-1,7-dioic acid hydratase in catechol pathway
MNDLVKEPKMTSATKHYIRYRVHDRVAYGLLREDGVYELRGGLFDGPEETGQSYALKEVGLLPPCEPGKILGVGLNYASHVGDRARPKHPEIFLVPASALLEPGGSIVIPEGTQQCEYEGELVVVMGKEARNVPEDQAQHHIFGVTCGNDVSARDWQKNDLQWWRAKGCDTFAPLGPVIAQGLNYHDLLLCSRLNGAVKQQQRTSDLIFDVHHIVSFISQYMTLYPGDVIYTGTPGDTSPMRSGDTVEVEIEGIGILSNRIA